jgi:hypothetical protein
MKTLIAVLAFLPIVLLAAETKKVCHEQKDNKGKTVQVCKEVKVHKKLDGTKVPPK